MFAKRLSFLSLGAIFFVGISMGNMAIAETLRIAGTGVALGSMSQIGAAFEAKRPGITVEVLPSLGSSGGVQALIAGAIDLSVSSRDLKEAEKEQGAQARLYATTPLAIVTSSKTKAEGMTTEELAQMYSGEITYWPSGQPVRVILRPVSETDTKMLSDLSDAVSDAIKAAHERPGLITATNDQENAEALERLVGSLGAVALGQIATEKRRLKILALDGVTPEAGDRSERAMKFVKNIYIVKTEHPSALASEFIEFLFSEEGRSMLVGSDHTPVG